MRLLIMGPPGAGKGTQGKTVAADFGVPAISTGDIFRTNVANKTELGQVVSAIMAKGELVPDSVTVDLVADRLAQADAAAGFLLDGFPRTLAQAQSLDEILDKLGFHIDAVISMVVDRETLVQRMLKRAEIEGRSDDNEDTIRARMAIYVEATDPLLAVYRDRGLLLEVDGIGTIDEVAGRITKALDEKLT